MSAEEKRGGIIAIAALVAFAVVYTKATGRDLISYRHPVDLAEMSARVNRQAPAEVPGGTLLSTSYGPNLFVVNYRLHGPADGGSFTFDKAAQQFGVTQALCDEPSENRSMLAAGVTIRLSYAAPDGTPLAVFDVRQSTCDARGDAGVGINSEATPR
ncbi:MAG: hypothetical protein HOO96_11975 [Polyangiaceae bacterium]|nr:hypothetical protein [Polyangiaceae bacterium]